jgi:hypothetical protein
MAFSFDGIQKHITLSTGTTAMSVTDMWSRWVDWWVTGDNSKYTLAMQQVGGQDIDLTAGTKIPIYIYLLNGWKIIPYAGHHTLNITNGILLVDGGGDPFDHAASGYTVRINYQQPVQAITLDNASAAAAFWDSLIEGPYSAADILRIVSAVIAGKSSGGPGSPTFRDLNDTKDRVTGTADSSGNRTVATYDATG